MVPEPGQATKPVVLVEDNGPIHTSKLSLAALAARAHWLTVEWLPKYAPELNDIEVVWRDLKAHHLAHQTFADTDALDRAIHHAIDELNAERMLLPLANLPNLCLAKAVNPTDVNAVQHLHWKFPAAFFAIALALIVAAGAWGYHFGYSTGYYVSQNALIDIPVGSEVGARLPAPEAEKWAALMRYNPRYQQCVVPLSPGAAGRR